MQAAQSSLYCHPPFVRSKSSPSDFDQRVRNYLQVCKWGTAASALLAGVDPANGTVISREKLPRSQGLAETQVNGAIWWVLHSIDGYNTRARAVTRISVDSTPTGLESAIEFFAPFLLGLSLAIGITKVTADIKRS